MRQATPFLPRQFHGPLAALLALAALAAPAGPAAAAGPTPLQWPVREVEPAITGTFMEPRPGRFHSGLDIRTGGRRGLVLHAIAAGSIVRARCSPDGYGLALYQQLDDGRTAVYAHLDAFPAAVQLRIVDAWERTRRYRQDLRFPPGEIRVEAGEPIGRTGATGVGAPHLHLELRDARQRPLDPLQEGLPFADDREPELVALRLLPAELSARVEGGWGAVELAAGDTVLAHGPLLLQARIHDRTPGAPFRVRPARVELWLGDERRFLAHNRSHGWGGENGQVELEIVRDGDMRARWQRLYRRAGNQLPGREGGPHSFALPPDGRVHRAELRLADAAGNEARFPLFLRAADPERPRPWGCAAHEAGMAQLRVGAGASGPLPRGSAWEWLADREGERLLAWPAGDTDPGELPACLGGGRALLGPRVELGPWVVEPDAGSFLGGGWASATVDGDLLVVRNHGAAWADGPRVGPPPGPGEGIEYRAEGSRRWRWLGGEEPRLPGPGAYRRARDGEPPVIGPAHAGGDPAAPARHPGGDADLLHPRWLPLAFPVADTGSGISADGNTLELTLDGRPWPARYDPEDERLWVDFWLDPGVGEHELRLVATDSAGNVASATHRFVLR